ncbi:MFS transporter [Ktedonobacter sp. SOSP1-52]|uniref:MFS transporter n=1 Tax=Ktedonobacter sp. SOSP1-52 TaxID=2778366 RepID=UPI001914F55E|nr:MFS transporter [Ktedonobacter sp. SOSP1-52]GHO70248.1 MFS transporter [Ktedonobacter sp. SOSP1-52]
MRPHFTIGLFIPFFVIYLHQVRGIALATGGVIVSTGFAFGLVTAPLAGILSDRFSARWTLIGSLCLAIAGVSILPFIQSTWQALAATLLLLGCGQSVVMPTTATLLASRVSPKQQTGAFTVRYTGVNIGFGTGATVAGFIINTSQPSTFLITYIAQAPLYGVFIVILLTLPPQSRPAQVEAQDKSNKPAPLSLSHLLKDTSFWLLWLIALLFYTVGISQLPNGFTLYATSPGHVGTQTLGLALALNSFVIVVLQFVVLRWMRSHLRTRALALLFLIWAAAWGCVILAGYLGSSISAAILFCLSASLLGLGETLMAPCLFPLVVSLAPEGMQGRYTATASLASTTGFVLAPILSGFLLGSGRENLFLLLMLLGCGIGSVLSLRLGHHLPHHHNQVTSM